MPLNDSLNQIIKSKDVQIAAHKEHIAVNERAIAALEETISILKERIKLMDGEWATDNTPKEEKLLKAWNTRHEAAKIADQPVEWSGRRLRMISDEVWMAATSGISMDEFYVSFARFIQDLNISPEHVQKISENDYIDERAFCIAWSESPPAIDNEAALREAILFYEANRAPKRESSSDE